jgi:hypothetical protein
MTVTTYPVRLFSGRNVGITYDNVAGTISALGQSLTLSTLSAALQAQFSAAVANTNPSAKPAFAGDNVAQAVGAIMDATPTWRTAVQTALATYAASVAPYNDPETWTRL